MESADVVDPTIFLSRLIPASRDAVFKAWTDPVQVARWWNTTALPITTATMEFTTGEPWKVVLYGIAGVEFRDRILHLEVAPPEHVAYAFGEETATVAERSHVRVTFDLAGRMTTLGIRIQPGATRVCDAIRRQEVLAGMRVTMTLLEDYLGRGLGSRP